MWNLNVKTALGIAEKECCYNLLCCRPVASSWSSWSSVWSAWSASSSTSPSAPMPWHQAWRDASSWCLLMTSKHSRLDCCAKPTIFKQWSTNRAIIEHHANVLCPGVDIVQVLLQHLAISMQMKKQFVKGIWNFFETRKCWMSNELGTLHHLVLTILLINFVVALFAWHLHNSSGKSLQKYFTTFHVS